MRQVSPEVLHRRLTRIVWLPMGLMAVVFLLGVGLLLRSEKADEIRHIKTATSELLNREVRYFSQEILLNRKDGVRERIDDLMGDLRQRYAKASVCIRVMSSALPSATWSLTGCTDPKIPATWESSAVEARRMAIRDKVFGELQWEVISRTTWKDYFPPSLFLAAILAVLCAYSMHRFLVGRLRRNIVAPLLDGVARNERDAATVQAIGMIRHDVRRPFSILKTNLEALEEARDKERYIELGATILPRVSRALRAVDAMLEDVIEVGTNRPPVAQEVLLEPLLQAVLMDVFHLYVGANIRLQYDLRHEHQLRVEPEKIVRVLGNIIENGIQAIEGRGTLWFKSESVTAAGRKLLRLRIGNDGPVIPSDDLARLFDRSFSTKRTGQGFGLAIAKQIVEAHGGQVTCISSAEGGTEFILDLPAGVPVTERKSTPMPENSTDLARSESVWFRQQVRKDAARKETSAPSVVTETTRPVVFIFDDEEYVHDHWRIAGSEHNLVFHHFRSWEEFAARGDFTSLNGAVAFVDIHYDRSKSDGYEIATRLRELGVRRLFAITNDREGAVDSGLFETVFGKEVPKNLRVLVA